MLTWRNNRPVMGMLLMGMPESQRHCLQQAVI